MRVPDSMIIENDKESLVNWLKIFLEEDPKTSIDIATGYFVTEAYTMLKDYLKDVTRYRLLIGKSPEIKSNKTLGDTLLELVRKEIEQFDLTKDKNENINEFIKFLGKDNVEIRLYDKEDFFHPKVYIFDKVMVNGSSNFTIAGLTHNNEFNTVSLQPTAEWARKKWFEKVWNEGKDFKQDLIKLIDNSKFGSNEYSPYDVFIKTMYEFQKEELQSDEEMEGLIEAKRVNLAEFQEDAIGRIRTRLKKYGGCLVADAVGLGKTWVAKRIMEDFNRKSLVICPAQLRNMWRKELIDSWLFGFVISHEELASKNFVDKINDISNNRLDEIELIIVDESHNFRNPNSNRWENFFTLVNDNMAINGNQPVILFLTATPMNNTIWDLYWQLMLLVSNDKNAFIKEGIPDLFKFFKDNEDDPARLNDLLNETSVRRTRDYIKNNYPDAEVNRKKIKFPERKLSKITYNLDSSYKGMYKEIADIISVQIKMPFHRILRYKLIRTKEEDEDLNRMIALVGIFRIIFLKRLESSVEAFRISINKQAIFLEKFKEYMNEGKLLSKKAFNKFFNKYMMITDDEIDDDSEDLETELKDQLVEFDINNYNKAELFDDIETDIKLLKIILEKIEKIKPFEDAKLVKLKDMIFDLQKNQLVLFTYFTDTLDYIYKNVINSKEFYNMTIAKISGKDSRFHKRGEELEVPREKLVEKFFNKEIDILLSTDVLSEGQNLQSAQIVINYDLHWNPTRMIQRAGRIDRIGSSYDEICIFNFYPEDELEELLKLVQILQVKISDIDKSVGLDQTILGEKINPKVFGIIRRIKDNDNKVLEELERDVFGGGEIFYQPLKEYLDYKGKEVIENIPYGVHSGIQNNKLKGIFLYYKYGEDFHYWYIYDLVSDKILDLNKTEIINYISCNKNEKRNIPDFFSDVFKINEKIISRIESEYNNIQNKANVDTSMLEHSRDKSVKFINDIIHYNEEMVQNYMKEFFEDRQEIEHEWERVKNKLREIVITKRRARILRKIWKKHQNDEDWKGLIKDIDIFLQGKGILQKDKLESFNRKHLKLVTFLFIS